MGLALVRELCLKTAWEDWAEVSMSIDQGWNQLAGELGWPVYAPLSNYDMGERGHKDLSRPAKIDSAVSRASSISAVVNELKYSCLRIASMTTDRCSSVSLLMAVTMHRLYPGAVAWTL